MGKARPQASGFLDPFARSVRRASGVARLLACAWLVLAAEARALDPAQPPERHTVTHWNTDDGLAHSQVNAITQSDDGFLWVATWEGTMRFDGLDFHDVERLRHDDGRQLPSSLLWREAGGSVLAGVAQRGLSRVSADGAVSPACARWPGLEAMRLAPAPGGGAWVAARDGLYRLQGGGECARLDDGGLAAEEVLALLAHPDGSLWVGNRRGLYRWREGRIEPLGERLGLGAGEVRAILAARDGDIWIAGDGGVWRHRGGRLRRERSERAEGLLEDRQGALWVAGTDAAVLRHWRGAWHVIDHRSGIEGYATGALFEDREGLVWFGTTHGLYRISDGPVWSIGRESGLASDYVRSLLQTADGDVWIGQSGGLSRMRGGAMEVLVPGPGLPPMSVLALAASGDGGVWAGTYNRGVLRAGAGARAEVQALAPAGSPMASAQVRALLEEPGGRLWIGTERGLVAWHGGRFDPAPLPGLPALPVRVLRLDAAGRLWIGFAGGLARREADGRVVVHGPGGDFPALSAFDVLDDADGTVWIASDRGLVRHRDGAFRLFGREQGFAGSSLFRVLDDASGNLWASSNLGVARIPRGAFAAVDAGRAARLEMQVFGRGDGMPSRQANGGSSPAGWRMADGGVWIPTAAGIAVFEPERVMQEQRVDVPLVIDRVLVDGVERARAGAHALRPGARLSIRYAGISLRNPNGLRYRYRMHGFDADWIEAGQAREATYTNLPPGELRFEVQAARAADDWRRPASAAATGFEVAAPWWRRPWAMLAAIAGLLLLFAGAHRWLGRRAHARARRLESQVAQRTEELRDRNRELQDASRQREELLEQLAHQANHDPLTGLPNRRAGDQALAAAVRQADHADRPLCVAIIDIDRFKQVNDRHGHHVGDRVLARVAAQLQASLRHPGVLVSRPGGEEFLVVLGDMGMDAALALLERARREVALLRIDPGTHATLACTISIGVAERRGREGPDSLLQRADQGLYAAKRQGRDRIVQA